MSASKLQNEVFVLHREWNESHGLTYERQGWLLGVLVGLLEPRPLDVPVLKELASPVPTHLCRCGAAHAKARGLEVKCICVDAAPGV